MTLAPIILFCYNRPFHVEQTLETLSRNELADQSVLYIYCDGPKPGATEEQKQRIADTRAVVRKKQWCKEVHIVEFEKNKGLAGNIVDAVTDIVSKYGKVITLEDDIITSKGFLKFMNEALTIYQKDERVMHISGYMWPHRWPLPSTFFYEVPYPGGGWATWDRAWRYYSDDTKSLYEYWSTRWKEFNKFGGDYLQRQLERNYEGTMRTWFIKWHAVMLMRDGLTLYPGNSLTNNIGFDSTGENCFSERKFDIKHLAEDVPVKKKKHLREHPVAAEEIYSFYQGRWYNKRRRTKLFQIFLKIFHK